MDSFWLIVAAGIVVLLILRLQSVSSEAREARILSFLDWDIAQARSDAQAELRRALDPLLHQVQELSGRVEDKAKTQFDEWRQREIDTIRLNAIEEDVQARLLVDSWKTEAEDGIRADARNSARSP